ncbi:hypothetical protein BJ912DRAFT_175546 [Pholiota molesta]|nr:hypothetical protein BJ912DRAFT_175546 [Pholiota molesta]
MQAWLTSAYEAFGVSESLVAPLVVERLNVEHGERIHLGARPCYRRSYSPLVPPSSSTDRRSCGPRTAALHPQTSPNSRSAVPQLSAHSRAHPAGRNTPYHCDGPQRRPRLIAPRSHAHGRRWELPGRRYHCQRHRKCSPHSVSGLLVGPSLHAAAACTPTIPSACTKNAAYDAASAARRCFGRVAGSEVGLHVGLGVAVK